MRLLVLFLVFVVCTQMVSSTDPAQVFVQGQAIVPGRARTDVIYPTADTGIVNVTLNMSAAEIAAVAPARPFAFVLYRTPGYAIDSLAGVQAICSQTPVTGIYYNDQSCALNIATNQIYSLLAFVDISSVTIRNMTLPVSADAYRMVTFQYDFKRLTFSIVDPPGSTMQAYSSDTSNYHDANTFLDAFAPMQSTSVPVFWPAYVRLKYRHEAKFTVFRPDPLFNTTLYLWRTTAIDISAFPANASQSAYNNNAFVFPCAGAGNELWGSDCATCDSVRFNVSAPASGLPKMCGQCNAGLYGEFCQYNDTIACQIGDCNGFGHCDPLTRECSCDAVGVAHVSRSGVVTSLNGNRYGTHCELDQAECSALQCSGVAACTTTSSNYSYPTCMCASVTDSGFSIKPGKSYDSLCANCSTGYLPGSTCTECAPGYYGSGCVYNNATLCAMNNYYSNYCGGRGECLYVQTAPILMVTSTPCNCTTPGSGMFFCDLNPCNGTGNPVSFQDAYGLPLRWYCNATVSNCTGSYRYWGLDPTRACYTCTENYTYTQNIYTNHESCTACKPGHYGLYCNMTSPQDCRAAECNGLGECADYVDQVAGTSFVRCQCDAGYASNDCSRLSATYDALYCNSHGVSTVMHDASNQVSSYSCLCDEGFYGPNCNMTNADCVQAYCFGTVNVTCASQTPPVGKTDCTCPDDYYDPTCASSNGRYVYCNNHGRLNFYWNQSWSCTCDAGYYGVTCLYDAAQCRAEYCSNNGACLDSDEFHGKLHPYFLTISTFKISPNCSCDAGFTGRNCELSETPFVLIDPASVNISVDLVYNTSTVALNTSLSDFGQSSVNATTANSTATGVVTAAYNSGVYFSYTAINVSVQSSSSSPTLAMAPAKPQSTSGLGIIFKRQHGAYAHVETQTTTGNSWYNISVTCAQGAVTGQWASGYNLTVANGDIICIDDGSSPGCADQSAPGYINGSLFTVIDAATGLVSPCSTLNIIDVLSNKTVTVVNVVPDTLAVVAKLPYSPTSPMSNFTAGTRDCVVTLLSFLSPAADRYYVVGQNCSAALDPATSTSLFIDVFAVNTTATETDSADLVYVTTQLIDNPYSPYSSDRVLWAPRSQRLLVRHPATGWNLIPLNPDTGLFDTGFLVAQTLPGKTFDPWMDVVLYDSGDTLAFVTFGTSGTLTTAFPIVVNITRFSSGFVGSSIRYLHQSISGFQPTVLSDHFSPSQIHISLPQEIISLAVVGGRVLLAVEKIIDIIEPLAPPQYVGLMCLLPNDTTIRSPNSQFCTDFNTQLDTGFLLSSNVDGQLVANPYLDSIQSLVVMPFTVDSTKLPMIVVFVRSSAISTFSISVSDTTAVITSKLVQEIDAATIDTNITNCTYGQFNTDGTLFVLVCEHVIAYFSVDQRSFFMTFVTKHSTPTITSKVCVSSLTGRVYAINNNITSASVYTPFLVQVPRESITPPTTNASAGSSSTLSTAQLIGVLVGSLAGVLVLVFVISKCTKRTPSYAPVAAK